MTETQMDSALWDLLTQVFNEYAPAAQAGQFGSKAKQVISTRSNTNDSSPKPGEDYMTWRTRLANTYPGIADYIDKHVGEARFKPFQTVDPNRDLILRRQAEAQKVADKDRYNQDVMARISKAAEMLMNFDPSDPVAQRIANMAGSVSGAASRASGAGRSGASAYGAAQQAQRSLTDFQMQRQQMGLGALAQLQGAAAGSLNSAAQRNQFGQTLDFNIAQAREAADQAAFKSAQEQKAGFGASLGSTLGAIGGGLLGLAGGPAGVLAGATMGGKFGGSIGAGIGSTDGSGYKSRNFGYGGRYG